MTKKKIVSSISLSLASALILSGCSLAEKIPGYNQAYDADQYVNAAPDAAAAAGETTVKVLMSGEDAIRYAESAGTYSETEILMLTLEYKMDNEGLNESEYERLAEIYDELGFYKCERDVLELIYHLYGKEEALSKLQEIAVNITEEDAGIMSEVNLILYDLMSEERLPEVIHSMEADEWFASLMPKISTGKRTYFREANGSVDFCMEVGYNAQGEPEGTVRFVPNGVLGDTTGLIISRSGNVIKVYKEVSAATGPASNIGSESGEKSFVLWTIDPYSGTIQTEEGTLKDEKLTGDYKVSVASVGADSGEKQSAFDLFNNRETLSFDEYTGSFGENGEALAEAPSEKNIKNFANSIGAETVIVYAYNADKTKCLYKGVTGAEKEAGVSFGNSVLDLPAEPEIKSYTVKDKSSYSVEGIAKNAMGTDGSAADANSDGSSEASGDATTYISESDIKVRIYGGEIQIYNGYKWISMGDAREIAEADPFEGDGNGSDSEGSGEGGSGVPADGVQVVDNRPSTGVGSVTPDPPASSGGSSSGGSSSGSRGSGSSSGGSGSSSGSGSSAGSQGGSGSAGGSGTSAGSGNSGNGSNAGNAGAGGNNGGGAANNGGGAANNGGGAADNGGGAANNGGGAADNGGGAANNGGGAADNGGGAADNGGGAADNGGGAADNGGGQDNQPPTPPAGGNQDSDVEYSPDID